MADLMAGIIVGIVALPLAIAFGIASGVSPEKGIITATPQISHRFHQIIVGNPLLYQRLFRYLSIHLSLLHLILCYFFHRYQSPTQQQRQFILTIRYNTQARMQWDRIHIHTTSHDSMHRYELNVGNR